MLNISQSLLHPDQYRFGIKSPVLLYSLSLRFRLLYDSDYSTIPITLQFRLLYDSDYYMILITTYNSINSIDQSLQLTIITQLFTLLRFYIWKLHFVNRYCFCNTELRTAIITKIKGLLIQTQQNTFVLFTLFKLTSDERKTLTKISTRKTSHNHSPKTSARFGHEGTRKPANNQNKEKEKRQFALQRIF